MISPNQNNSMNTKFNRALYIWCFINFVLSIFIFAYVKPLFECQRVPYINIIFGLNVILEIISFYSIVMSFIIAMSNIILSRNEYNKLDTIINYLFIISFILDIIGLSLLGILLFGGSKDCFELNKLLWGIGLGTFIGRIILNILNPMFIDRIANHGLNEILLRETKQPDNSVIDLDIPSQLIVDKSSDLVIS